MFLLCIYTLYILTPWLRNDYKLYVPLKLLWVDGVMGLCISPAVRQKLRDRHNVKECEIFECFANREKGFLIDTREEHESNPPTLWFVAETDYGRILKVVFIHFPEDNEFVIRTTYQANPEEIRIYNKYA